MRVQYQKRTAVLGTANGWISWTIVHSNEAGELENPLKRSNFQAQGPHMGPLPRHY